MRVPPLLWMGLAEQGQRADALHDFVAPPIPGVGIVHRRDGDPGQRGRRRRLAQLARMPHAEIIRAGKLLGEFGPDAHREEAPGIGMKVRGRVPRPLIQDPAEVGVAPLVLHIQEQGSSIDTDFSANDGMDPSGLSGFEERYGAMQISLVGQGDCGEPMPDGPFDKVIR